MSDKRHAYRLKSIPSRLAEFHYNRGLQRLYTSTHTILQETINGFLCPLIVSLESEIHQLNFEGRDYKLNRNVG